MKRLLGLLLVMGMVGCGGGGSSPKSSQTKVDEPPVQTVDASKLVTRDGLRYEGDSETPFTGVAVKKYDNGQKSNESTYKDGKQDGLETGWYANGQKELEVTCKDGKLEGLATMWHENGQKAAESTFKDGKEEGLHTDWHENGQKAAEAMFKDGKLVSETNWDEEGNEK